MKRKLLTVGVIVFVSVTSFYVARHIRAQSTFGGQRKSFFVKMYTKAASAEDPSRFHEIYYFYGIRSDASYVRGNYRKLPDGSMKILTRSVTLIPERRIVGISEHTRSTTTFFLKEEQIITPKVRFTDPTCATSPIDLRNFSVIAEDTILGFRVFRLREVNGPAEHWRSPDLDCYPLRSRFEWRGSDGRITAITEEEAVSVSLGEPPAELFDIPTDYTERTPSQHTLDNSAHWAASQDPPRAAPPLGEDVKRKLAFKDQQYEPHKANAPK